MAKTKNKTKWGCKECGYESASFLGRCPSCQTWSSFTEIKTESESSAKANTPKHGLFVSPEAQVMSLDEIPDLDLARFNTGFTELNRVLGGGIIAGSLTLIGGNPGIGKSTILLQVSANFAQQAYKVLYISAEESSQQLKSRASRLKFSQELNHAPQDELTQSLQATISKQFSNQETETKNNDFKKNIFVYTTSNLEKIIQTIREQEPDLVIVDSIQAIYLPSVDSVPGSVTQIRECTGNLMRLAKTYNIPIFIVGHITKDGELAGPKILEHMVDTVLQFEGDKDHSFRILRAIKNRFGSTDEIALFDMSAEGLSDLKNPSEIFLRQRSGGIIVATLEGKRTLLLELQSLVLHSEYHNPRRLANGIEALRLHQILAVIEKKLKVSLSKADVYLNVVGGLNIREPAADLAVALSIYQSATSNDAKSNLENVSRNQDLVVLGEIGLSGEVRAISNIETRLKEIEKLGFKKVIIPHANLASLEKFKTQLQIHAVKNLAAAIDLLSE